MMPERAARAGRRRRLAVRAGRGSDSEPARSGGYAAFLSDSSKGPQLPYLHRPFLAHERHTPQASGSLS
jgi:hypothetical protein